MRAVFFDMDGTAVRYEGGAFHSSWDALGHALVNREPWDAALRYYYPRKELYGEWLRHNAGLLAGKRPAEAEASLFPGGHPPYSAGFEELVRAVRGRLVTGILTSGVDVVARRIQEDLDLDVQVSNHLVTADGRFTGQVVERVPLWEKDRVLREAVERFGLDLEEVAFVGDSENDGAPLRIAGLPVLFRPKPVMDGFRQAFQAERGHPLLVIQDFRELIPYLAG